MYFDQQGRFDSGLDTSSQCSEFRYIAGSEFSTVGPKFVGDWKVKDHGESSADITPGPGAYNIEAATKPRVPSPQFHKDKPKKVVRPPGPLAPGPGSYYSESSMIKPSFNRKLGGRHGGRFIVDSSHVMAGAGVEGSVSILEPPVELVRSTIEERREVRALLRGIIRNQDKRAAQSVRSAKFSHWTSSTSSNNPESASESLLPYENSSTLISQSEALHSSK